MLSGDDRKAGYQSSLDGLLARVVAPVMGQLVKNGEFDELRVSRTGGRGGILLRLVLKGEQFEWYALTPGVSESFGDARRRFASELGDFIAESQFGWGEQRQYVEGTRTE